MTAWPNVAASSHRNNRVAVSRIFCVTTFQFRSRCYSAFGTFRTLHDLGPGGTARNGEHLLGCTLRITPLGLIRFIVFFCAYSMSKSSCLASLHFVKLV